MIITASLGPLLSVSHRVSAFRSFQPELPVTARPNRSRHGALDRNTAQLSIGTAMHSGSEHRKTGRAFSYLSNATSKHDDIRQ